MTRAWPLERLPECLNALAAEAGDSASSFVEISPPGASEDIHTWLSESAQHFDCEAQRIYVSYRELADELKTAAPAIFALPDGTFLALVKPLLLFTPDRDRIRTTPTELCALLTGNDSEPARQECETLLGVAGIGGKDAARAAEFLAGERLGSKVFQQGWILRPAPGARTFAWLRNTGAIKNGACLLAAHTLQYLIWIACWALLGNLSFSGHLEQGWVLGWSLLLATLAPVQVFATWMQGALAIGTGGHLKRRLLDGALKLQSDEVRHRGIGSFLGQTFESDALESMALGGGIAGALALLDIAVSGLFLGKIAWLLLAWVVLTFAAGYRFLHCFERWSGERMSLTENTVECMTGHRTRLAQQAREDWHKAEDRALDSYLVRSRELDRWGAVLVAVIPRGWLVAALIAIAFSIVPVQDSAAQTAVKLGGILLAFTAFARLGYSCSEIAAAVAAWKRVRLLFDASGRKNLPRRRAVTAARDGSLLETENLRFTYSQKRPPVLDGAGVAIRQRDRVLLEGPSGGGKTTLAALLSGCREPDSGLLLLHGLDQQTTGSTAWRRRITLAPQFHENHIFTAPLAFNLLLGREWPPSSDDLQEADSVCRSLGLGPLLDRMPSGLMQMVGDGGWRLSHGERSRVFLARGLLQNPELLILDESFGALDPENLQTALQFTLAQANALMVIAHP